MTRRSILFLALVAAPAVVRGHEPNLLDPAGDTTVAKHDISYAYYGTFETGNEVYVLKVDFTEDYAFPIEVFVPHRDDLAEHRPAYAVVAKGLPEPTAAERAALPRDLPPGMGAFVDLNVVTPRPVFFEFVTRRFFWSTGPTALAVAKGPVEIWVWSPKKTTGKVGVGFGVEEGGDFSKALSDWAVYAY